MSLGSWSLRAPSPSCWAARWRGWIGGEKRASRRRWWRASAVTQSRLGRRRIAAPP